MVANIHWTDEELEILRESYRDCSWEELYQLLPGRSYNSIYHKASENNLLRPNTTVHIDYDKDFFSIPTICNSYWAGFIAADGHIRKRTRNSTRISIKLSAIDYKHLLKFSNDINFSGEIKIRNNRKYKSVEIKLGGANKAVEDLSHNFNITENKSKVLIPPVLDREMSLSYIIGYIDGDGCLSKNGDSNRVFVCSPTQDILIWIKSIFDEMAPDTYKGRFAKIRQEKDGVYTYRIAGRRADVMLNIMRNINSPKLERKWLLEML